MNELSIEGLEKLQYIPGDLEGSMHTWGCVDAPSYAHAQTSALTSP